MRAANPARSPPVPFASRLGAPACSFPRSSNDIGALRRCESRLLRGHGHIALDVIEEDGGRLPELVLENHPLQITVGEAEQRAAKIRIGPARLDQNPVESLPLTYCLHGEVLAHIDRS